MIIYTNLYARNSENDIIHSTKVHLRAFGEFHDTSQKGYEGSSLTNSCASVALDPECARNMVILYIDPNRNALVIEFVDIDDKRRTFELMAMPFDVD